MSDDTVVSRSMDGGDDKATAIAWRSRLAILGLLAVAILIVQAPKFFVFTELSQDRAMLFKLARQGLMFAMPFALARLFPSLASFEIRWLPAKASHWLWFLGLAMAVLIYGAIGVLLLQRDVIFGFNRLSYTIGTNVRPITVVLFGIVAVLVGPVVEEVFYRGFVLSQLRKSLGHWSAALLIQSILFALAHLATGFYLFPIFLIGLVFGAWRIKFGSLIPLIIAHAILNAVILAPQIVTWYDAVATSYPSRQRIDVLATRPPDEALPELIKFLGDPHDAVSGRAIEVLDQNFHNPAEPYLKEALRSRDPRTVDQALFAIQWSHYPSLSPQVRELVWSAEDLHIQLAALAALDWITDGEEVREIAQEHPNEKIRNAAKRLVEMNEAGRDQVEND